MRDKSVTYNLIKNEIYYLYIYYNFLDLLDLKRKMIRDQIFKVFCFRVCAISSNTKKKELNTQGLTRS